MSNEKESVVKVDLKLTIISCEYHEGQGCSFRFGWHTS